MAETRDERRERKDARGIEQFREHIGAPAPLTMTPQAVYHWTRDDQADALAAAREAEPDTGFMMRLLALCTLPRTNPGSRDRYVRRNGPFSLVMIAGGEIPKLPYGNIPRLLLAWVCTEAVRTQSRTLVLGRSLAEFMRTLGFDSRSGGRGGERTRLQNQMQRLFSTSVQLSHETVHGHQAITGPIASAMSLWWDPRRPEEPVFWDSTIRLGEDFFNEIIACPVPLDMNVLKAMRRSPLGLDLYLWLTYRLFGLTEPYKLTWRQLYRQFGVNQKADKRIVDDFRKDVLRELGKLKDAWAGFDYRTPRGSLELRPTRPLIVPSRPGAAKRRPGDTDHAALRRHMFRVLAEHPELLGPEHTGELAEEVKTAAARAGIPYDADTVTAALNAGRTLAQAQTSDRRR